VTEWNDSFLEGIPSALGVSVHKDLGVHHTSLPFHVSNDKFIECDDGGVWDKNDWGETVGMKVFFGNGDALSTFGGRSVETEAAPSLASAESASSFIDASHSFPEELQSGFELGNPSFWMTEADSNFDMNFDPTDLDMMELLTDFPT
jgi:hypothetical protein